MGARGLRSPHSGEILSEGYRVDSDEVTVEVDDNEYEVDAEEEVVIEEG